MLSLPLIIFELFKCLLLLWITFNKRHKQNILLKPDSRHVENRFSVFLNVSVK